MLQTFSKASGWRINTHTTLEKPGTLGRAVTSDPAYFGLLSFMSIDHDLLLLYLGIYDNSKTV